MYKFVEKLNYGAKFVPYPYCTLITSLHEVKLWEESVTDKAKGMQQGYKQSGAWSTATRGSGWVTKDDCPVEYRTNTRRKDDASSGGTKFKLQMVQSIPDAMSTGKNGECDGITACFAMS